LKYNKLIQLAFETQYELRPEYFVKITYKSTRAVAVQQSVSKTLRNKENSPRRSPQLSADEIVLYLQILYPYETLGYFYESPARALNKTVSHFASSSKSFLSKIITISRGTSLQNVSDITLSAPLTVLNNVVLEHSPVPSSAPTSRPSCSLGSFGPDGGCGMCPPGYYGTAWGQVSCAACPVGFYSSAPSMISCTKCRYPYTTLSIASRTCDSAILGVNRSFLISVMGTCALLFLFSMNFAGDKKIFMFFISFTPALNFFAALMYMLTMRFYSQALFHVAIMSFLLPNLYFTMILLQMNAPPFLSRIYPGYKFLSPRILWFTFDGGYPAIISKLSDDGKSVAEIMPIVLFADHESLIKLFFYLISVIVVFFFQLVTLGVYLIFIALISPIVVFWFFIGCYFYQSKLISMKGIWNMWFRIWSGSDDHYISAQVDSAIMNESFMVEFLFLTIPQLVVQIANNTILDHNWTIFSWICFAILASSFVNGISRYGYYLFVSEIDIIDVPLEVNLFNKTYKLESNKSFYSRNNGFGFKNNDDPEKALEKQLKRLYKEELKSYKDKTNRFGTMDEADNRAFVAWNILINYAGDTTMLEFLRKKKITSPEKLKNASTEDLADIKANIKDPDMKIVIIEVFKTFPSFDDGSFTASVFTVASKSAIAEESITVEAL